VGGRYGVGPVYTAAIKGSRRSNPATYTGLLDPIRKAFAKANDVKPALFSANSEGACPTCKGAGVIVTELGFMDTVSTPCASSSEISASPMVFMPLLLHANPIQEATLPW
jgi:excinuclease UvrABC ATPase subunit